MTLQEIGLAVRARRRELKLTQKALAQQAQLSLATISALENGALPELGTVRLMNLLNVLSLALTITPKPSARPTLDELYAANKLKTTPVQPAPRFRG
jgi:transcriptional regulator with XRE-family HTH domain